MSELALQLFPVLLRTTLLLSVAAAAVYALLRATRCSSARAHRVAWCLALELRNESFLVAPQLSEQALVEGTTRHAEPQ